MNISKVFAILFVCFNGICSSLTAQQDSIHADTKVPGHPRILLLKGEEKQLAASIRSNAALSKLHNIILEVSDSVLNKEPVQNIKIGIRLLDKSREFIRRVFYLSYAYRLTGSPAYLKRAEKEMLAIATFSDWNPSHFLDVAEMTLGMAIGYDWLYNNLSPASRQVIKMAILKKGIEPSLDPKYNWWLTRTNNWNQVCNAGISYGALAIYEENPELSRSIVNRAVRTIKISMNEYAPDGAYTEGYMYWGYGTSFNVLFLSALEKTFGQDFGLSALPGFLKTGVYFEHMAGPTGNPFNYFDATTQPQTNPAMFWFSEKLKDPSLLWCEMKLLNTGKKEKFMHERLLPACLVWSGRNASKQIPAPKSLMYYGSGQNPVVLMRTSWTDKNAIYVGIKGGSPGLSHGHMDAGSFIMESDGVRWAMDFGMQDYESLESKKVDLWNFKQNSQRWNVFRYNNLAHNTLTVNGAFQRVEGVASIIAHSDTSAVTDITSLYKGALAKAVRGIAIMNQRYVVVRDEIETTGSEATIRWTMATPAQVEITGANEATLIKDGKKLFVRVEGVSNVRMKTWSTTPVTDYDEPNAGTTLVGFEVSVPANTKHQLKVLLVRGKAAGEKM